MGDCVTQQELKSFLASQLQGEQKENAASHFAECETCLEKLVALSEFEEAGRRSYPDDHIDLIKELQQLIAESEPAETDEADAEEVRQAIKDRRSSRRRKAVPSTGRVRKGDSSEKKTGTGSLSRSRKRSDHSTVWALLGGIMFVVLIVVFFVMMGKRKKVVPVSGEKPEKTVEEEEKPPVPHMGELMTIKTGGSGGPLYAAY